MAVDYVVDACSFKLFYDELVQEEKGQFHSSFQFLLDSGVVILDAKGLVRREWADTCCGAKDEYFNEWLNNRIIEDKIQERNFKSTSSVRSKLRSLGVPNKDHKYVHLATTNAAKAIVSDDIDLFDPTEKGRSAERVNRIKRESKGAVSGYLWKEHKVIVLILELVRERLV